MNENLYRHIIKVSIEKRFIVQLKILFYVKCEMLFLTWPSSLKKSQNFEDKMIVNFKNKIILVYKIQIYKRKQHTKNHIDLK